MTAPAPADAPAPGPQTKFVLNRAPPAEATAQSPMEALLALEAEARRAPGARELAYLIANETRRVVPSRQTFVVQHVGARAEVTAVSSLAGVDRTAGIACGNRGHVCAQS